MAMLGAGALAMWWDIAPDVRREFEDWHSHEHFAERMAIPGFLRATRWTSTSGDGIFVMYEVQAHDTLASPPYLARLNAPSPGSTRMMPHHRNMVRGQCRVLESHGGAVARHALTLRFTPAAHRDGDVRTAFGSLATAAIARPGLTGMHLLQHHLPAIRQTHEQKLRSGTDEAPDHVLVACGYDLAALQALADSLTTDAIAPGAVLDLYCLSHSATQADIDPRGSR
jgi:hypothetical protein